MSSTRRSKGSREVVRDESFRRDGKRGTSTSLGAGNSDAEDNSEASELPATGSNSAQIKGSMALVGMGTGCFVREMPRPGKYVSEGKRGAGEDASTALDNTQLNTETIARTEGSLR